MAGALRELFASFFVDFDKDGAIKKGDHAVDSLGHHLLEFGKMAVEAFAVHEIVHFSEELIETADRTREAAEATGTAADNLQRLEFAYSTAGVGAEELHGSLAKLNKVLAGSAEEKGTSAALLKLGIDLDALKAKGADSGDILEEIGVKLAGIKDPSERAGLAAQFFGRSYSKLLPLFAEGREGIEKLKAEAGDLGGVFDEEFLKRSDEFGDNMKRIHFGIRGLAIQAIGPLLPELVSLTQGAVSVIKEIVAWTKHTGLVTAGLTFLKAKGIQSLIRLIPVLVGKMGGWRAALGTVGKFALRTLLPLLLLEDVIVFLGGGKSAIGRNLDRIFGPGTQQKVRAFIGAIGDFLALFKTAPDEIRQAFANLPRDLAKILGGFGSFLGGWGQSIVDVALFAVDLITGGWENAGNKLTALWAALKETAVILWTEVKFAGLAAAAALSDAWDDFMNKFREKVGTVIKVAGVLGALIPGAAPAAAGAQAALGAAQAAVGPATQGDSASAQVSQQWDEARLKIASDFDQITKALAFHFDTSGTGHRVDKDGNTVTPGAPGEAVVPGPSVAAGTRNTTNIEQHVNVRAQTQNTFQVAAGTDQDQQRDIANKASGATTSGVKKALDTNELHAQLVPRPG